MTYLGARLSELTALHPSGLRTMAHGTTTRVVNTVALPRCCPVSGNPAPGSVLRLFYRPQGRVLEVLTLQRLVCSYVGGHVDKRITTMEAMVEEIAQDCADALSVPVRAVASIVLESGGEMRISVRTVPAP